MVLDCNYNFVKKNVYILFFVIYSNFEELEKLVVKDGFVMLYFFNTLHQVCLQTAICIILHIIQYRIVFIIKCHILQFFFFRFIILIKKIKIKKVMELNILLFLPEFKQFL